MEGKVIPFVRPVNAKQLNLFDKCLRCDIMEYIKSKIKTLISSI